MRTFSRSLISMWLIFSLLTGRNLFAQTGLNKELNESQAWSDDSLQTVNRITVDNDACITATPFPALTGDNNCVTLTNQTTGGTFTFPGCLGHADDDVWYTFTGSYSAVIVEITITGGSPNIVQQLYSGLSCNTMDLVSCHAGLTGNYHFDQGQIYYLRIYTLESGTTAQFDLCMRTDPCPQMGSVAPNINSVGTTTAAFYWDPYTTVNSWDVEVRPFPYTFTGIPTATGVSNPYFVTGLQPQTSYAIKIRPGGCSNWGSPSFPFTTATTAPLNDEPWGAYSLPVGVGCPGSGGGNSKFANQSPGEPFPSCVGTQGYSTVWFKFVAPPSGFVRISNDNILPGLTPETRIALFSTTDVNDYSAFTMISCDDNNGYNVANRSIIYANGLVPGNTYYIAQDGVYPNHTRGSYCISVTEVASTMISQVTSCFATQPVTANNNFDDWLAIVDYDGRLVAMVRNPNGSGTGTTTYTTNLNINSGPVRSVAGYHYLDRNFQISNPGVTNAEIRFFYLNNELNALTTANPLFNASTIGVLRQQGASCNADLSLVNGLVEFLPQTANGVSPDGTLRWFTVSTPGFSNFYLSGSYAFLLPIHLLSFAGQRDGTVNRLHWTTATEQNSRGFDVLRSADGVTYESIGFVNTLAPVGNSADQLRYSFVDNNVGSRKYYYRLRLMDLDGRSNLSTVVLIKGDKPVTMTIEGIYPNPASSTVNVMIAAPVRDRVTLAITDMSGKNVHQQVITAEAGSNTIPLDISRLTGGSYIIKLLCDNCETVVGKFVKQ